MNNAEIDNVLAAPFKTSVFGDTLENIMERQKKDLPNLDVPNVLIFLSNAIISLNGCKSEGIFRVPGEAEAVSQLRCRIERNDYTLGDEKGIVEVMDLYV